MEEAISRENSTPKNIGNISTSSSPSSPESGELGRNISNCAQIPLEKANHLMRSCPTMKSRPFSSMVRVGCGLLLSVTDPAARNCQIRNLLTQHPMRRPVSNRARPRREQRS